jgi:hypothetical protein
MSTAITQLRTICSSPDHERHLGQRADRGYCMNYIRLPRPPHWHAQHWSTRAPRLPSPAATIDETIHLPPDALEWASTLMAAMCIIRTIVRSVLISPECPRLVYICLDTHNERCCADKGSGWGADCIDIRDELTAVAVAGYFHSYCVIAW